MSDTKFGEPWAARHGTLGSTVVCGVHGEILVSGPKHESFAERIVACINACAGMDDPQAEIERLRACRLRETDLEFICAACGSPTQIIGSISLDSGTSLVCAMCGETTVTELFTSEGYVQRHGEPAEIERLRAHNALLRAECQAWRDWNHHRRPSATPLNPTAVDRAVADAVDEAIDAVEKARAMEGQ